MLFNLMANVSAIINVVALVFIFISALYGLIRGFAKTFISVFGTFLSLMIAVLLCSTVASFLQNEFLLVDKISLKISGFLTELLGNDLANLTISELNDASTIGSGVGGWLINIILKMQSEVTFPETVTVLDVLCPTFAYYIVVLIVILILFIFLKVIFFLISEMVIKLYTFNLVKSTDKLLGFFLGLISGIINLEFIIMALGLLPIEFCQTIYSTIIVSPIGGFIHNINLFEVLMKGISFPKVSELVKTLS